MSSEFQNLKLETLTGSVDRIVFRNPDNGFCVARFRPDGTATKGRATGGTGPDGTATKGRATGTSSDGTATKGRATGTSSDGTATKGRATGPESERTAGDLTTIVGTMPTVQPGEVLTLEGSWETHPAHGRNFQVEGYQASMPSAVTDIQLFLASGVIRGIGPVTAERIVDAFGDQTIEVLDRHPERLKAVRGVTDRRLEQIKASWEAQRQVRDLAIFLKAHGLSIALASQIHEAYGTRAQTLIQDDPYRLAEDVRGIGFRTADEIASRLGIPRDSESRYVAGLKFVLSEATEEGHVFLGREELLDRSRRLLGSRREPLEPALLELLRRGEAVAEEDALYLRGFYRAESGAAELLETIRSTPSSLLMTKGFDAEGAIEQAAAEQGLELADNQLAAARQALREKVSLLTGGPGTGKTSTLRTVITALEREEVSFCLCAPTGRAAKRVAETTGRPASTIHRLLEFQPAFATFARDQNNPLEHDFVVVDEVSMIDALLFYQLLKAIPAESHLLLVGDADQLPAVGPGNVLGDLIASGTIPTTTLTELFRQARGSQIVLAAHAVNRGEIPAASTRRDRDFFFLETASDEQALAAILRLVHERIPEVFGLDPIDDIQVLSPMHRGLVGVTTLNEKLQELLNPIGERASIHASDNDSLELRRGNRLFRTGDKVMQVKNNYEKDVFNGDVGKVLAIEREEQRLLVGFENAGGLIEIDYAGNDLDQLVLAYAASVHKAQGGEFPCVVMPLVPQHQMLLQRNLLYTAITRARLLCVLVGSKKALERAVTSRGRGIRNSQLAKRLREISLVSP